MNCDSCYWSSCDPQTDMDADTTYVWRCWRESGPPQIRLTTARADVKPPACIDQWDGEGE